MGIKIRFERKNRGLFQFEPCTAVQAFEDIESGIVPPDAEFYIPYMDRWVSMDEFERECGHHRPVRYKWGFDTYDLKSVGQARRWIRSGKIHPDAEIHYPQDNGYKWVWMSVKEFLELTSAVRPLDATPPKDTQTAKRRARAETVRETTVQTAGCLWAFILFAISMAAFLFFFIEFVNDRSSANPLLQLALVVGLLALAGSAWAYFEEKIP
jgi:hypothetical protein